METIQGFIRAVAGGLGATPDRYDPEMIRVYFTAPDEASTKTITEEGNFQWLGYELLFKKIGHEGKPSDVKHYIYRTPLFSWGVEAPGGQEVEDSDISPEEVKKNLKKLVSGPDLYPAGLKGFFYNVPESAHGKFNPQEWIKISKKYPFEEFNRKFRQSGFYKTVTKGKQLKSP